MYTEFLKPTEEELRKQALLSEKAELETWLKEHDYIGTKIALMNEEANRTNDIDRILE